jgi:hypothetical protein
LRRARHSLRDRRQRRLRGLGSQYIPANTFPDDLPVPLPAGKDVLGRGGAAIIEPSEGEVIAGPLYGEEGMLVADCDLRVSLHAKRWFDVVGHYSREEILPSLPGGSEGLDGRAGQPSAADPAAVDRA